MNANYSEALEQQVGLLRRLEMSNEVDIVHPDGPASAYFIRTTLEEGHTLFVAGDISEALRVASRGLAPTPLVEADIPLANGFAWMDRPYRVLEQNEGPVRAISWCLAESTDFSGLAVVLWILNSTRSHLLATVVWWQWGKTWADWGPRVSPVEDWANEPEGYDSGHTPQEYVRRQLQFIHSLFFFMNQKILTTTSVVAERHARKRLERENWYREPLIRVVELRHCERVGDKHLVESGEREWSCQWIVRGHWRQQPYPKAGEVRPRWITPYVKGPDDKPLKPPRATVFAVVR